MSWLNNYRDAHRSENGKTYKSVDKILDEGIGRNVWLPIDVFDEVRALESVNNLARNYIHLKCLTESEWLERYVKIHKGEIAGVTYASVDKLLDEKIGRDIWFQYISRKEKDAIEVAKKVVELYKIKKQSE